MSNISLGYTMFQEIGESMNDQVACVGSITIKIKLVSPDVEWRTYLSSLSAVHQMWISKGKFDESSFTIVHR